MSDDTRIGITTTIPAEAVYAAGFIPVDCNNSFIMGPNPAADVACAESAGFPRTICAWIKGIYGAIRRTGLRRLIGVVEGDCSETQALMDVLEREGVDVIPFAFPRARTREAVRIEIEHLCARLGTTYARAEDWKARLDAVRADALALDDCAWRHPGRVHGAELFTALVNTSDVRGDPASFQAECRAMAAASASRPERPSALRLGVAGVPGIITDLVPVAESMGATVIYHEIPRQFALPFPGAALDEAYTAYTYPYALAARLDDVRQEVERRRLDGIIHYVQSFCHRQLHDRLLRDALPVPVLTVEGDAPGPVDARIRTRLEAFCETLHSRRNRA